MTLNGWMQILIFFGTLLVLTKPLGSYMARVYSGARTLFDPVLRPVERLIYRVTAVDETREMRWTEYAVSVLLYSVVSMLLLYAIQRLQAFLPFNPQGFAGVAPDLAFNTAASFTTNTNWQAYAGEATMSYFTQMAGLAHNNFTSAAVGMAVAIALIRGISRRESETIGNFWVDLVRGLLWVLLPLSLILAILLVSQGVVQNFRAYDTASLIDPQTVQNNDASQEIVSTQIIPQGPAASQIAIKMLGTNGGGFFNANSAHPFENPTPFSNLLEMLAIFLIPAGLTYTLGRMTGSERHGWAVFAAMSILFFIGVWIAYWAESRGNPIMAVRGIDLTSSAMHPGGNMEGKEVRFGIASSALFATVTTDASCGAVNSMHDSFTPLGGFVPLVNMQLGEVIFGGVGAGMYGMLVMVIISVFIAGLMVGRTPEYLGKKIESYDVKMAMLYIIIFPLVILILTSISLSSSFGLDSIGNQGPHGLTQVLYAFTSGTANNGSAFGGLNANTLWYNTSIGFSMLLGRFFMMIPVLAIAGNLARKKIVPPSLGTFPVTTFSFVVLLISVIIIVGALTFFPVLSLGPIVEHFLMQAGKLF